LSISLTPTIEQLISLAQYGGKYRLTAAREIAYLDTDVDLDKLFWLIDILSTDVESPEFSELGIALSKLLERMNEEKIVHISEMLLNSKNRKLLLTIVLSNLRKEIDPNFLSEIVRRLLMDSSEEVRNGALGVLRNLYNTIGKDEVLDILYEIVTSENRVLKKFLPTIILSVYDFLDTASIEDLLLRILDESDEEVLHSLLDTLRIGLLDHLAKSEKVVWELAKKIKSLNREDIITYFARILLEEKTRWQKLVDFLTKD